MGVVHDDVHLDEVSAGAEHRNWGLGLIYL